MSRFLISQNLVAFEPRRNEQSIKQKNINAVYMEN